MLLNDLQVTAIDLNHPFHSMSFKIFTIFLHCLNKLCLRDGLMKHFSDAHLVASVDVFLISVRSDGNNGHTCWSHQEIARSDSSIVDNYFSTKIFHSIDVDVLIFFYLRPRILQSTLRLILSCQLKYAQWCVVSILDWHVEIHKDEWVSIAAITCLFHISNELVNCLLAVMCFVHLETKLVFNHEL